MDVHLIESLKEGCTFAFKCNAYMGALQNIRIDRGTASLGPKTYEYILTSWLPNSDYALDARPHFAVIGEKYKGEDPESEEEFWIPVKPAI